MNTRRKLINKISIFKENNPRLFVIVMILLINVISVIVSSVLLMILPENKGRSLGEIIRFAFTLMVNPSGRYIYSDYPISLVITTLVVLIGMISLTGGTVGYVTNVISNIIERSNKSSNTLKLYDHIVILNYNHKVPIMLNDFCFDDDINSTCIVILSSVDRDVIYSQIESIICTNKFRKKFKGIIIRNGDSKSKYDLDKISVLNAKTVFIMTPESQNSNQNFLFDTAKVFMYISHHFKNADNAGNNKTQVIVETENETIDNIVSNYNPGVSRISVDPINYNELLGKSLALITINPSLNKVLSHLMSFEGVEFYITPAPDHSIEEDLMYQNTSIPVYDFISNGKTYRAYISENAEQLKMSVRNNKQSEIMEEKSFVPKIHFKKNNIAIIGSNRKLHYILESFVCYNKKYPDHDFNVVLVDVMENKEILDSYYSNEAYRNVLKPEINKPLIIHNIYNPVEELMNAGITKTDSVIFLSEETEDFSSIDEKPLFFWSNINNIECSDMDMIVEILDSKNENIINRKNEDQVIVSDKVLSGIYALLSKDSGRIQVIKDLLTIYGDDFSLDKSGKSVDKINIFSLKASDFFAGYNISELRFKSKRELILWSYRSTSKKYIVIGCIKNGREYLFPRIDADNDVSQNLDGHIMLEKNEDMPHLSFEDGIYFDEDDEIIAVNVLE